MLKDDLTPGQEGDEGTVTPKDPEETTPPEPSSDPLDAIKDPEDRAIAKRQRAIDRRLDRKEKEEPAPAVAPEAQAFATKDDLKKLATNDAKKLVPEYVKDAWDELVAIPLAGFDPMDAESIAMNMQKRYKLYLMDNPDKAPDPSTEFTSTPHMPVSMTGGTGKSKVQERPLPGYKESAQPDAWYKE